MSFLTSLARVWLTKSFQPFIFTSEHDDFLSYNDTDKLGLYVHIPFCRSICGFCPYCKTAFDSSLAGRYVNALLHEIDMVGQMSEGKRKVVTSLYFGGGSPALIAGDIRRIIGTLQKYFQIKDGIGLELHPRDVTENTLAMLKRAGVTKISIGVQSFQQAYLEILGRRKIDAFEMTEALSKVNFKTVSMDFIFALPGQTIDILKSDIEFAFSHGANHIAVYPFVDFTFTVRNFPQMNESLKKKLLYELVNYCERQGYVRDSIWTFSKEGGAGYSSMTRENFLGFGCSATTLLKERFKINTFDVSQYIKCLEEQRLPTAITLKFTAKQRMLYYIFWSAYTMRIDTKSFRDFFQLRLENCYRLELWLARKLGWIQKENGGYMMTTRGSYYYHYFERFYTLSYIDRMWNLMRRTAFPERLIIR